MSAEGRVRLMDAGKMAEIISRMSEEIAEAFSGSVGSALLVGIHTRGVYLARRISQRLAETRSWDIPVGKLDINLYRDDWTRLHSYPVVRSTHIPVSIDNRDVILVDDVLYTGRTIRAALDGLLDFGRPRRVHLAVLIDRGHRELPICAQYIGQVVETLPGQHVHVLLEEVDGRDEVVLTD
ncbi:bifunctional pyr operon transcriptional regulator/uracil phosphoribosyltransferase PyrR [Thermodesulforhabdus norvegica]|uniref:Bifunctional protein PyrR n=1 Tax=Thermodesulforhabdus norvegica TaxID=39841 RepID=A0A1I4QIH7_9BACT|nr:bifunctional pyr operon transcriptional regulator/uracil phosphoribosyltransferase PyrR [Thermodesulforhabdus norvegica]SFM39495.1 pyrimidine operon attenuation protein / uracil phosphoribosyltransferase [Thermodesulforhabdus norvegica]